MVFENTAGLMISYSLKDIIKVRSFMAIMWALQKKVGLWRLCHGNSSLWGKRCYIDDHREGF